MILAKKNVSGRNERIRELTKAKVNFTPSAIPMRHAWVVDGSICTLFMVEPIATSGVLALRVASRLVDGSSYYYHSRLVQNTSQVTLDCMYCRYKSLVKRFRAIHCGSPVIQSQIKRSQ